jgi:hypothetical protein
MHEKSRSLNYYTYTATLHLPATNKQTNKSLILAHHPPLDPQTPPFIIIIHYTLYIYIYTYIHFSQKRFVLLDLILIIYMAIEGHFHPYFGHVNQNMSLPHCNSNVYTTVKYNNLQPLQFETFHQHKDDEVDHFLRSQVSFFVSHTHARTSDACCKMKPIYKSVLQVIM